MTRLLVAVLLCLLLSASACVRCDIMRCDTVHTMELRPGDPVSVWKWRHL